MKKSEGQADSTKPRWGRRTRARGVPKWLREQQDLDEIARRRCLIVLRVLSGETSVSEAIEQVQVSRNLYYQLEERALNAMLRALTPGASAEETAPAGAIQRAQELEEKVARLEKENRRAQRLTLLTRKLISPGTLKTRTGRPRKNRSVMETIRTSSSRNTKPRSSERSPLPSDSAQTSRKTPISKGATKPIDTEAAFTGTK